MTDLKKLQVFTFSDNFGWPFPDVQAEAMNSAIRRAEVSWSDVSVRPVTTVPIQEGATRNYMFEIWGVGETLIDETTDGRSSDQAAQEPFRKVAKDADI